MKQTIYNGRNVQVVEPTARFSENAINFRDVTVDGATDKTPRTIQSIEMKDTGIIKARRILNGFQQIELNNMDNKIYLKNLTTNRDYEEEVKKKRLMRIAKGEDPDLEQEHIFINTDTGENNLLGLGGTEYKRAKIKDLYVNNIFRLTNPETEHIMVHHPIDINKMYINEIRSNNSDDFVKVSGTLRVNTIFEQSGAYLTLSSTNINLRVESNIHVQDKYGTFNLMEELRQLRRDTLETQNVIPGTLHILRYSQSNWQNDFIQNGKFLYVLITRHEIETMLIKNIILHPDDLEQLKQQLTFEDIQQIDNDLQIIQKTDENITYFSHYYVGRVTVVIP